MSLPVGSGLTPLKGGIPANGLSFEQAAPHAETLTTAGGVQTLTAAELKSGLLLINTDDAQTLTLPTATLFNAGINGAALGERLEFDVINIGDATLTVAVGTGGSLVVGNSKSTVATIVANASKKFVLRVTGVASPADPSSSDSYVLYGLGSVGAATA